MHWTLGGIRLLEIRREAYTGPQRVSAYWKLGEKRTLDLGGCPHMWGWCNKRGLDPGDTCTISFEINLI